MRARLGKTGADLPEDAACNDLSAIYQGDGMDVPFVTETGGR
jgi:hypothetical protein